MDPDVTRILVLGGTGHIGCAIARHFDQEGYQVSASGRSASRRPNLEGSTVQQLSGDDSDPVNLENWIGDADVVVDAATPYPVWIHETRSAVIIDAARRRIRAILELVRRRNRAFIHISSFTTLPPAGGVKAQLSLGAIRGMHPYFELKEVVEKEVLDAVDRGLKGGVVNPAACIGPYDLKPEDQAFIPMLLQGKVLGLVRHPVNVIDVRDVAACIGQLVRRNYPYRRVPLFGHNIGVADLARRICALGGVAPPSFGAPVLLGAAGLYWLETAAAMTGRKSPWPSLPALLVAASSRRQLSAEQIALDVSPRPLEETLRDALAWYRQIGRC